MAEGANLLDRIVEGLDNIETRLEEVLANPLLPADLRAPLEAIEQAVETIGDAAEQLAETFESRPIRAAIERLRERIREAKAARAAAE